MRRGRWPVFAAAAAIAAAAAAVLLLSSDELSLSPGDGGPSVAERITLRFAPRALAVTDDGPFLADASGRLYRLDDDRAATRLAARVGKRPSDIAAGFDSVWVASRATGQVTRVSSEHGRRLGLPVPVADDVTGVAVGERLVWASANLGTEVGPRAGQSSDAIVGGIRPLPAGAYAGSSLVALATQFPQAAFLSSLATDGTTVWVTDGALDRVYRLERRAVSAADSVPVGGRPVAVAVGYGAVWVANADDGTVSRIDTGRRRHRADPIQAGGEPADIVAAEAGVWVADRARGQVVRIEPDAAKVDLRLGVGRNPVAIAAGDGSVWVIRAGRGRGELLRIEP